MAVMAANPFDQFDEPSEDPFADLVPKGGTAVAEEDPFADLVPKQKEEDPFADLVPKANEPMGPPVPPGTKLNNAYDPETDRLVDPAAQARFTELSKRKWNASAAKQNPLTSDEDKEFRYLKSNVPTGLEGTLLDPKNAYLGDPVMAARMGVMGTDSGFSTGKLNPQALLHAAHALAISATGADEPRFEVDDQGNISSTIDPEAQKVYDAAGQPVVTLPKPTGNTVAAGIARGLATTAEGLTTPTNLALLATLDAAPAVVARVASAGFAASMVKELPEQLAAIGDAENTGDKAQRITEAIATAAMIVLSAKHAQDRVPSDAATRAASMEQAVLRAKALNEAGNPDAAAKALREAYAQANIPTGTVPEAASRVIQTASGGKGESTPSKSIEPQVLDGLVRSRNALVRAGAHPQDLAEVNQQISAFDPAAVTAAEARATQPPPPTAPAESAEPPVSTGGPSAKSGTATAFEQARAEQLKAAGDLASTAAQASEASPLAAAEAAKLAADIAAKADQPPTTEEHAPTQISEQKSGVSEHPGVPPREDVRANENEVRQEGGGSTIGGGGTEPAAEVPAAEAEVAPPKQEPVAETEAATIPENEPATEGPKEPAPAASQAARDAAHERAYALAQRIGEEVAQGQPDIVKEAATIAAYKNAASSIDSHEGAAFNPDFMRKSAMRAAGEAAKKQPVSLDEPTGQDRTGLDAEAYDQLSPDEHAQRNDLYDKATKAMEALSEREREIVRRVTMDGDAPADVAEDLGISRQAVEQINAKALEKVRKHIAEVEAVGEKPSAAPEAPKSEASTPETETPAGKAAPEPPAGTEPPEETSAEKPSSPEATTPAEPAQARVVALRKSFTDAQREKMGLPAWDKPAALTNQEAWDEGQRVLAENPKAGEQLVEEMKTKPRALNPYEKSILLHEEGVRDTEYHAAIDAANKATTEQEYLSAQVRLDAARDANQQFYDAARAAGRASGQSLQAHKMALDTETWTLARMEDAIQARKPFGEKLTDTERAEIKDLHEQIAAERERADKAEAALKDIEVAKLLDKIAKDQRKQARADASAIKASGGSFIDWVDAREKAAEARIAARRTKLFSTPDILNLAGAADHIIIGTAKVIKGLSKFPEWFASMKGILGDEFEPHAQAIFDESKRRAKTDKRTFDEAPSKAPKAPKAEAGSESPKGPKTTEEILGSIKEGAEKPDQKTIYDLVKSKIEANPDVKLDKAKVSEIMQEVRDDLQPHFPDITEDEVRDAFSGHGKITYPSKELVNVKMRELRAAGDLISKIGEAAKGEHPQQTGKRRDKPTQFLRDLTKEVIRTMRENGVDTKALEGMIKTAHDARVTRLKNSIEDVQAQIAAGKRTPKTPGTPWTPEELALRQELSGLHEKLDSLLDEPDSDQLNRIMNRIEAVTEKLDTGNIEPRAKSQNVPTKAVAEATEKLRGLNEELANRRKALREAQNPPKTEEEKKIATLERQEEKLTEQIRTGKIDQPGGKATVDPKALAEAKARVAELRKQIVEMRQAKRDALNPPKTEEEKTLAALEKRQRAAEEALRTGNLATKGGRPSVDTEKVTKAKADLKEINQKLAEARKKSADGIQRELDRYKKMIDSKRAELQRRIATGDVSKPVRNPLSPEKTAIAKPLKLLQDKWEVMKRRQELKSQTLPQKILRWATYLGHEMLLLSPAVGVKLSSAAATTAALIRPLEEVVGYGIGKALPFLAEKADVEIAPSVGSLVHHEAKAAAEAFMNVVNDIGSTLKHGKSDFELEFGKEYSNEMVSYVGRFHGAFKTIPARQAFTATFLRLAEKYAERGLDITDPDVRFSIGTQALFKAIESKFQDPNLAVGAFRDAIRYIDRKSPFAGAITKAVAHTEMPVMTVASNLTWRALENVYGLPVGSARIANMYLKNLLNNSFGKKGGAWVEKAMSDMSTEQADSIAKQLKRGTVGAAAFLVGAYLYQNLGGMHEKGEKQKQGDVKPEEVRPPEVVREGIRSIPLVGRPSGDIPKEFVHHPTFVDMQAGATMMRVAEEMKNRERQGIGRGLAAAAIDTAAESPFGSTIQEGAKWIDPATRLGAEGNFARTFLGITGPLAWLAKKQDIDPSTGEPVKRKATTIGEELKLGIPGKRKEVPQARTGRSHATSSLYR